MAVVKWDPLRELRTMQEEMNRLFELSRSRLYGQPLQEAIWQPPVDIYEAEGEVVVKMEVPEVSLEEIQVTIEDGNLIVQGVRQMEKGGEQQNFLRIERCYGHFRRLFALPADIDQGGMAASCDRGVLKIVLPKKETSGQGQIEGTKGA